MGTGSGTDALTIALRLHGVSGPGREVITTPLTAPFTALAVIAAGARPVFADIDEETLLLDPAKAAAARTPDTAAFLPVHLYGQTCDLDRWGALAEETAAALVQDACQAHGALHRGRPLTSFSRFVAYSFYPTKNLGALGDGGALVLDREPDAEHARSLRDGGRKGAHVSQVPGLNSRLDELQAAWLRVALKRLAAWNNTRRHLAGIYDEELAGVPGELLQPVGRRAGGDHVYHLYVVRTPRRDALRDELARHNIGTGIHYPVPLHLQPAFAGCGSQAGDLPVAERAAREILSLPIGPHLGEEHVRIVARHIRRFLLSAAAPRQTI